jgi:hypothetical protein
MWKPHFPQLGKVGREHCLPSSFRRVVELQADEHPFFFTPVIFACGLALFSDGYVNAVSGQGEQGCFFRATLYAEPPPRLSFASQSTQF